MKRRSLLLSTAAPNASLDTFTSATEMQRLLRAKKISARELLDLHLKRINEVNPKVNAIVTLVEDQAKQAAQKADEAAAKGRFLGLLHGLPTAHKDLQDTKGIRTTYGSPLYRDHVPTQSTLMIERIQAAGAITLGKTNTPEFGAGSQTFNPVFGATRNPYDLTKTSGGSSGGAAAAVASGMLPIADGSDTGGSLRNPAAFCSAVGFRTSPGRVPRSPSNSAWSTISVNGPIARTVEDVALFLAAMAGPDPASPLAIHEPGEVFLKPLARKFKGVKIAWMPQFAGLPFHPHVREVFATSRKTLEAIGCTVEETKGPDFSDAPQIFRTLRAMSFHQQHAAKVAQHRSRIKATVLEEVDRGAKLTGPQIEEAETKRSRLFAKVGAFLQDYEYMVLPVTQVPAFNADEEYVREIDGLRMPTYLDWMSSCWYITVPALPAISVPGGFTREGLPVGIQIVGRHHADFAVLQLAYAFEQASPKNKRPSL